MNDMSSSGGFLLSPAPSSTFTASTSHNPTLPRPREHPLKSGGAKESAFIRYADQQLLTVQRRFAKRTTSSAAQPATSHNSDGGRESSNRFPSAVLEASPGYRSMKEACKDIEELVDVVWVSGTPSLQVPYLINLALLLSQIVPAMPVKARSLFRVLAKLDHCFASLITGKDVETGEALPGFEGGRRGLSGTEKVRIRSLVERTRVAVVEAFKKGEFEYEEADDGDEMDTDMEGELVLEGHDLEGAEVEGEDSWDMQLAGVYDRTIVELGDSLEEPGIGILTERRG